MQERLDAKVSIEPNSGCWLWTGVVNHDGYGLVRAGGRSAPRRRAHRVSFEVHVGPIPARKIVCHHCDNPPCVNPAHLFLGDDAANVTDMEMKGRARHPRGAAHGNARISDDVVALVRARAGTASQSRIAADLGMHRSTVGKILRGERRAN
jgi:hypothetical protein